MGGNNCSTYTELESVTQPMGPGNKPNQVQTTLHVDNKRHHTEFYNLKSNMRNFSTAISDYI